MGGHSRHRCTPSWHASRQLVSFSSQQRLSNSDHRSISLSSQRGNVSSLPPFPTPTLSSATDSRPAPPNVMRIRFFETFSLRLNSFFSLRLSRPPKRVGFRPGHLSCFKLHRAKPFVSNRAFARSTPEHNQQSVDETNQRLRYRCSSRGIGEDVQVRWP